MLIRHTLKLEIDHLVQTILCRNLSGNKLSGSIPSALQERSNNHSLLLRFVFTFYPRIMNLSDRLFGNVYNFHCFSLPFLHILIWLKFNFNLLWFHSVDGNPDLCLMAPCKKEKKKFVVPLIAATVSALVVLTVLVVLWSYKRKQGIHGAKLCIVILTRNRNHLQYRKWIYYYFYARYYHIQKNKYENFLKKSLKFT